MRKEEVNEMNRLIGMIVTGICVFSTITAMAQVLTFQDTTAAGDSSSVLDVYLRYDDGTADNNYGVVEVGRAIPDVGYPSGYTAGRHHMFWFDVSSIAPGTTISGATLNLYFDNNGPAITDYKVSPFMSGNDWIEGTTNEPALTGEPTWNSRQHSQNFWEVPGATGTTNDIDDPKTVTVDKLTGNGWVTVDVTGIVQDWIDTPANNKGMLLWGGDGGGSAGYWNLSNSEDDDINLRPYLQVDVSGLPPLIDSVGDGTADADSEYVQVCRVSQGMPVTWSLVQGPAGAQIEQIDAKIARVYGWTPTTDDMGQSFTFEVQASGNGSDTESWQVTVPVAGINNGFHTDYFYALKNDGSLRYYKESDGSQVGDYGIPGWTTLTFSGVGEGSDAWLYGVKPSGNVIDNWFRSDFTIEKMNSEGLVVQSVTLSSLLGPGSTDDWAAEPMACLRYSSYHNTLFLGVNRKYNVSDPAIVYEIDLGLSAVLNTYTGPNTLGYNGVEGGRSVRIDINTDDGTLYMISRNLGGPSDQEGDLVALDTSAGSTSTYTTLIDGTTFRAANPTLWDGPGLCIFRHGSTNPTGRPTILIAAANNDKNPRDVLEFFLDQIDDTYPPGGPYTGNLVLRGTPCQVRRGFGGQQDMVNGSVWIANQNKAVSARRDRGVIEIETNDNVNIFAPKENEFYDVDSPPYKPCHEPFADADEDGDVDQNDFAIFQLCFTGTGGVIPSVPNYCGCFDRDGDTDIDSADFVAFQDCATGPNIPFDMENPPPLCNP